MTQTISIASVRYRPDFYRLFWLFLIASVLGDWAETAFWLVTRGELVSRSSLLYGQFSLVWGLGAALLTLALGGAGRGQGCGAPPRALVRKTFLTGAALGGIYEYVCSWLQEMAFGMCFWDYRHLPLNLNGRVNLPFCFFWGAAAVLWARWACPALCRLIDAIPRRAGTWLAVALAVFLAGSSLLSAAALYRMNQRHEGAPAAGRMDAFLDQNYPDERLRQRYPNMGVLDEIGWYD